MHRRQSITVSTSALLDDGIMTEGLTVSELPETSDDSALMKTIPKVSQLSLMQESLVIANEMTLTDKLSFYAQSTPTLNLFQKLEVDSILNGVNSSKYWNEYAKVISQHLSSLTPIEPSDLDSHLLNGCVSGKGVKLLVLNQRNLSPEAELVEDILSILHCFSARLYGLRKYKNKVTKEIQDKTSEPDKEIDTQQCQEVTGVSL